MLPDLNKCMYVCISTLFVRRVQSESKSDVSTWFSMFAELDPLSNPDAFGQSKEFSIQA